MKTVLDYENSPFSSFNCNAVQIHIDHAFCEQTQFGKPLMNSIFTLGLVIGLSVQETTLGTKFANLGITDTTFPCPVFSGDMIRA